MPAIYFREVPDESENPIQMENQSVIQCGDRMIFNLSKNSTAQVVIYNALGQMTEKIAKQDVTEGEREAGKYYHDYYYNGTEDSISEEIVIDQDTGTEITLYTKPTDSLYQAIGGVTLSVLREYDANILIANTGTDKMYPTLYSKGTTKLKKDNKIFCSFNLNDERIENELPLVEIDNKLGILKCYGKILDLAKNTNGIRYYNSVEYNDQCFIESGRPEILKVVQISEYKKSFSGTGVTNV